MKQSKFIPLCALTVILLSAAFSSQGQTDLPEVFKQGSIPEQLKFLDERTRIYENYRAIREDMYRVFSRNTLDSLNRAKSRINTLMLQTTALDNRIDSLQKQLEVANQTMTQATKTKNSIRVLGIEVGKTAYNSVMWSLVGALAFLLTVGFLLFKQNRIVTVRTRKEFDELKTEFEDYRTKTRLDREKTAIEHFNEIKKLKGK